MEGVGNRRMKKRRETEIILDIVDWKLSGIFSASTGFHNPLDGYLLLLGNSSCVKSTSGFKKIISHKGKKIQIRIISLQIIAENNGKHLKQNLCIFSLFIRSIFLIDLGVATGSVSLLPRRLLCKL